MDAKLGGDILNQEVRMNFLKDNCDAVEKRGYMKRFTQEELLALKEELSDVAITINDIEEEKKVSNDGFKAMLKGPLERKLELLNNIKKKAEYVNEACYKFIDTETREVGYYNSEGDLVETRPASADELQKTIFQVSRTGTNN